MLQLEIFVFSPFSENTFVVWDDQSSECMVVDPGCVEKFEEDELSNFIADENLTVKYLINTHCHIDHIFGNRFVLDTYSPPFYAGEEDVFLLEKAVEQAKVFGVNLKQSPPPNHFLTEDLSLNIGEYILNFIFTPGHTPGEYCLLFSSENICITGDVLFREGIGRTDLWGGDYATLISSIKNKLFPLPDEVTIFPGHGPSSSIGHEKQNNPFLKGEF